MGKQEWSVGSRSIYNLHLEFGLRFSYKRKIEMKVCLGERRGTWALIKILEIGLRLAISKVII